MTVSAEIAAAQAAYAARPYAARIVTEGFSGTFRFDTQAQAVQYLRQQIERHGFLQPGITNNWSNKGVRVYDSYVEMPDGGEIGLEDIGLAAQMEGPAGRWILLDEGEILERRMDVGYGERQQLIKDLAGQLEGRIARIEGLQVDENAYVLIWEDARCIGFQGPGNPIITGFEHAEQFVDREAARFWIRAGLTDGKQEQPLVVQAITARYMAIVEIQKAIDIVLGRA